MTDDELRELSVETHEVVPGEKGTDYHVVSGESPFTASRLLALDDLARKLTGRPIGANGALVSTPTRFSLLLHPIADGDVTTVLLMMAQDALLRFGQQDGLSPHVHWWRDGELTQLTMVNGRSLGFEFPREFKALLDGIPKPAKRKGLFRRR